MVELLVAHGANLNAKSVLEETPLGETRVLLLLLFLPFLSSLFMRDTFAFQIYVLMRKSEPNWWTWSTNMMPSWRARTGRKAHCKDEHLAQEAEGERGAQWNQRGKSIHRSWNGSLFYCFPSCLSFLCAVKWCVASAWTSAPVSTAGSTTKRPWCGRSAVDSLSRRTTMRTDRPTMSCTSMPPWWWRFCMENVSHYCFCDHYKQCKWFFCLFVCLPPPPRVLGCYSRCSNITFGRTGGCRQENYAQPREWRDLCFSGIFCTWRAVEWGRNHGA